MEEGSDYTSAESSDQSSDIGGPEYEIAGEEVQASGSPATELPIIDTANTHHNKKKKHRSISFKTAFRRGRNASKALDDLRRLLEEAIQSNLLMSDYTDEDPTEIQIWGIPLLPSKGHGSTDAVLLKFLRSRDWKVPDAYEMLFRTLTWRRRENIDGILSEKIGIGVVAEKMVFSDRRDREGRPLCFNMYEALEDAEFYKAVFGTERSREEFLRWRIQSLERVIRTELAGYGGGGAAVSMIQISDLKNVPAKGMADLFSMGKKMLRIFQDYYPDIVYKNIIVNPPSWFNSMVHEFLHQHCSAGTRKKFVVERHSRITSRLLKYIEPQNIPVQYGGLKQDNDEEFAQNDDNNVYETVIKGGQHGKMEIPAREIHVTIVWDVMVVGWGVTYKEEFVPDDEGSYKIELRKEERKAETVRSSYYINEPGKIVINIRNSHFRRKRVFWRYKCKPTLPAYVNN